MSLSYRNITEMITMELGSSVELMSFEMQYVSFVYIFLFVWSFTFVHYYTCAHTHTHIWHGQFY